MANYGGISLVQNRRVVRIDPERRIVELDNGHVIVYGQCLLATGGRPRRLPQVDLCSKSGRDLTKAGRVSYFRGIDDFKRLLQLAEKYASEGGRVAVVGGGFLGSELAISLSTLAKKTDKLEIIQVYRESGNMAHVLPDYLSTYTRDYLSGQGVHIRSGVEVTDTCLDKDQRVQLTVRGIHNGDEHKETVDHVIVAVGIEPNTDLASSGLETDPLLGGYLVNAELQSREGVYVAGDACSYFDTLLGRRRVEHVNHAEESGKLAGKNMAAAYVAMDTGVAVPRDTYRHQSSFWSSLAKDLSWDAVGNVNARQMDTHAFFAFPLNKEGESDTKAEKLSYDCPGVVFYLRAGRIEGILLWNLPDDLYFDEKHFSPTRLSLARKILADRKTTTDPSDLAQLVREFDLYETIDEDYQELKSFMAVKEQELKESKSK